MAPETLKLLLAKNAKIEARENYGDKMPMLGAEFPHGHTEALKVLPKNGATIEANNTKNATPLIRAVIAGCT